MLKQTKKLSAQIPDAWQREYVLEIACLITLNADSMRFRTNFMPFSTKPPCFLFERHEMSTSFHQAVLQRIIIICLVSKNDASAWNLKAEAMKCWNIWAWAVRKNNFSRNSWFSHQDMNFYPVKIFTLTGNISSETFFIVNSTAFACGYSGRQGQGNCLWWI